MKPLKYQEDLISNFNNLDFENFDERELKAYRWVFEDIDDIRNFLPPYILDASRPKDLFTGYALSFFITKESGIKRLKSLTSNKKNLFKKLGTHIAEGELSNDCGISNNANELNHFDLFEYIETELKNKFSIIEKII